MPKSLCVELLALSLLGACASIATRYYVLAPAPAHRPPVTTPFSAVAVATVRMPPGYGRLALTTTLTKTRIRVAREARWTAPLKSLVRQTLLRDLHVRLKRPTIVLPPGAPVPATGGALISLTVDQFVSNSSGRVSLDGSFSVHSHTRRNATLRRAFDIHVSGAASQEGETRAMSKALARLSRRIARTLHSLKPATGAARGGGRLQ